MNPQISCVSQSKASSARTLLSYIPAGSAFSTSLTWLQIVLLSRCCKANDTEPMRDDSWSGSELKGRRPRGVGITIWSVRMGRFGAMNNYVSGHGNASPTSHDVLQTVLALYCCHSVTTLQG